MKKYSSKNRVPRGDRVLEERVLGGGDYCNSILLHTYAFSHSILFNWRGFFVHVHAVSMETKGHVAQETGPNQ